MKKKASRSAKRVFRIATLIVPSWLAWYVAFSQPQSSALGHAVMFTLGPMWILLMATLIVRVTSAAVSMKGPVFAQIDVLTAAGSGMAWVSAASIAGAVWLGWASLAIVGLLGTGVFHGVLLYTLAVVRGSDPMRAASISRRFTPEIPTEGDDVIEEVRFENVRIPLGFRLFASARIGPRFPTSRYVLDASESGSEVVLESNLGAATRGEHEVEPLSVWLQDTFGLCRSLEVRVESPKLVVLPKMRPMEKQEPLLARGIGPSDPKPTNRLPTEGLFRMREYQPGDDVRRIHWVRSLASRELIVRLPDESPPDRPCVRLVLDTFFPEALDATCDAPAEVLDSLISVWLATARSLAETGVRVTLVAPVTEGDDIRIVKQDFSLRAQSPAIRLGAKVAWQNRMMVDEMLDNTPTYVVSRGILFQRPPDPSFKVKFIFVMPIVTEPPWPYLAGARLPFPMGTPANRFTHRREVTERIARQRADHARVLRVMRPNIAHAPPGSFTAYATAEGIRLEAVRA